MRFSTEKIILLWFIAICIAFSLHLTDGKTSIVIKELLPKPAHSRGYAYRYDHGAPVSKYHESGRTVRDVWKLRARRENSLLNYASRYKTWSPYKEKLRREPPIKDFKPVGKRRRPLPPHQLKYGENEIFYPRRPGRPYKNRFSSLQRPTPPAEDDFDEEDYFPEESKRAESHFDRDGPRRPAKKRRNPSERKKKPKKPVQYLSAYDDDRRVIFDDDRRHIFSEERPDIIRSKPKRQPSVSYSTFIQHSPGSPDVDYDYADEEDVRQSTQKKKRRIKKKTNKHKEEEEEEYRSDKYSTGIHRYPPLYNADEEFDPTPLSKHKLKKYKPEPQPIYGEGHISHQVSNPVYSSTFFRNNPEDYPPSQQSQKIQTFNTVSYPQTQTIVGNPQGYKYDAPYNSYSQPSGIQYNKITQPSLDYSQSNVYGYSGTNTANYIPGSYVNSPVNTYESLTPSSSSYVKYKNYQEQQQSQDSPIYYSPGLSYHKNVGTSYKTGPAYDSTDTFTDFNSNAGGKKHYPTYSSKYSEGGGIIPSVKLSERPDHESDFLQKHQNLYNNGINGIPIQGDGYMNKEVKKDYDIGYGEFQFDENPA